jgi:ABC-type sulfate/molybdate transport systems ATPase subunit
MCWRKGDVMLKARIVKQRRDFIVDVSVDLEDGASVGLFGASGSGKSTVLACIAGIEEPDSGSVYLNDARLFPPSLPLHKRRIGYLTQEPGLFPHLSVRDNVHFGIGRSLSRDDLDWIDTLRARLRLEALWNAPASMISGGQARRVSLARMLARRPPLVLLDEPFAGLDRGLVRELIDDLLFWSRNMGFSMIAVDHQAEVLQRLCPQQAVVLEQGKIVQQGPWKELCCRPATALLKSLLAPL